LGEVVDGLEGSLSGMSGAIVVLMAVCGLWKFGALASATRLEEKVRRALAPDAAKVFPP